MEAVAECLKKRGSLFVTMAFFSSLMVAMAELGAALSYGNLGFSTCWPPSGLFFASLTFIPDIKKHGIYIVLAAAIANVISDLIIHNSDLLVTLCFIASNTLSALSAALVTRKFLSGVHSLNRLKDMFIFLGCGLLIQSPIAATFGLWFQTLFWNQNWTSLKWVAWWSSNAIGITCFSILSLYLLQRFSKYMLKQLQPDVQFANNWINLGGTRGELFGIWAVFLVIVLLVQFTLMPPWGIFIINVLYLIWSFRFGVLHSALALAIGCIFRLYHSSSHWEYMSPFSEILLLKPFSASLDVQAVTVISIQLFIIERSFVVNIASALFTDLHLKQRALVDAAESRERLMARMSHEIRTPLSGVLGLVEAWAIKERSERRAHDLQLILKSAAQLKRVIDDVLDFSKLTAGKLKIHATRCQLRDLFSEIISLHSSDAQRKGLNLKLNMSDSTHQEIMIDSVRLRQIVNNLLANAIKFTPHGSVQVRVDTKPETEQQIPVLQITVEDTGIGIPKSALTTLFQPFEQVGNETTRAYGGTGLGLAICRELTELLGGHISVESARGVGSRFTVILPFRISADAPPVQLDKYTQKLAMSAGSSRNAPVALVVEDDPVNQLVSRRFLEAEGFRVQVAESGSQALAELEANGDKYSIVLMDYFMPAMDGCEVTRRFRAREQSLSEKAHLPILGLTASVLEIDHQRCRQAGMDDVLLKPIERERLRDALKKSLHLSTEANTHTQTVS